MSRGTGYLVLHVRLQDVKDLVSRCVVFSSQDEPREDINEMVGRGGKGCGEMDRSWKSLSQLAWVEGGWSGMAERGRTEGREKEKVGKRKIQAINEASSRSRSRARQVR
jgi:hypothetical protein